MRDPERIGTVLWELGKVWAEFPDMRLGQLIENVVKTDIDDRIIFYIEDDDFLRHLETFAARHVKKERRGDSKVR